MPADFQSVWHLIAPDLHCSSSRLRGATVARLTPDQKVACSNHVGVKDISFHVQFSQIQFTDVIHELHRTSEASEVSLDFDHQKPCAWQVTRHSIHYKTVVDRQIQALPEPGIEPGTFRSSV